jgi:hypothetical protein
MAVRVASVFVPPSGCPFHPGDASWQHSSEAGAEVCRGPLWGDLPADTECGLLWWHAHHSSAACQNRLEL